MGEYAQDIKKIYKKFGDKYRKQAQEQSGIECIDAIRAMLGDGYKYYLQGNVMKYIWRHEYKNGVEDLHKAQWYLTELIDEIEPNDKD
jgi:hypothetical protein